MAKKRRTRAQKQRAAARRLLTLTNKSAKTEPAAASVVTPLAARPPAAKAGAGEVKSRAAPRTDLRISLILLGSLLGAQVILWLVFRATQIDERLYNWIKL